MYVEININNFNNRFSSQGRDKTIISVGKLEIVILVHIIYNIKVRIKIIFGTGQ